MVPMRVAEGGGGLVQFDEIYARLKACRSLNAGAAKKAAAEKAKARAEKQQRKVRLVPQSIVPATKLLHALLCFALAIF